MTATIGLICDHGSTILLAADAKVSWGTSTSNLGASKIYDLPLGLFAAISDDVGWTHVFIGEFHKELSEIPDDEFALDNVKLCLRKAGAYVFRWMRSEILTSQVGITEEEYLHDKKLRPALKKKAKAALKIERLPIEMIVAGYTSRHTIFLYTDGIRICEQSSPGIFYGGSGGERGQDWLNFRKQNVHYSSARSFVHISEALLFSGLDAFVGERYGVLLIRRGVAQQLTVAQGTAREHWVRDWASKVCARSTSPLDDAIELQRFNNVFELGS